MNAVKVLNPQRLEQLRLRRGLTREDASFQLRQLGVRANAQQLKRWERGENAPRAGIMPSLASVYGVSIDELYGDPDDEEDEAALLRDIEQLPVDLRRRIVRALERRETGSLA